MSWDPKWEYKEDFFAWTARLNWVKKHGPRIMKNYLLSVHRWLIKNKEFEERELGVVRRNLLPGELEYRIAAGIEWSKLMRINFQSYDEDHSVMVLVIPKDILNQIGLDENTDINIIFFEGEMRISRRRYVQEMGIGVNFE